MKKRLIFFTLIFFSCSITSAMAADTMVNVSIQDALGDSKVKEVLDSEVAMYWGDQQHPAVEKEFGEFKTSQRSNAFRKPREGACHWALASSLKVLQQRARREGGDAIINIQSNIQNKTFSSETEFECLAGSMMVNVAVKGTVVKLAK